MVQIVRDPRQIGAEDAVEQRYKRTNPKFLCFLWLPEALFDHMVKLRGNVGVNSIKQILQLLPGVDIGDVSQNFHLFLKLILEEPVVDADDSLDVNAADHVLHQVLRVEPRFYEVHATHEPLFAGLPLLQPDVSSCFELGQQLADGDFVDIP